MSHRNSKSAKRGDIITTKHGTHLVVISERVAVYVHTDTEHESWWHGRTHEYNVSNEMLFSVRTGPYILATDYVTDQNTKLVYSRSLFSRSRFYFYKLSRRLAFIYRRGVSK